MKELKYRAWELGSKSMVDVVSISFNNVRSFEYPKNCGDVRVRFRDDGDEVTLAGGYELMQFTGSGDENGVDIYEGDIIKTTFDSGSGLEVVFVEVTWNEVFGGWNPFCKGYGLGCKVVGNRYENPELLEKIS